MARRSVTLFTIMVLSAWLIPITVQAATLTLVPVKNTVFQLRGQGLVKVGGIDATLEYDAAALTNPRVTAGGLASGALVMANAKQPGVLRFAIVQKTRKGISGRGNVATISFDRVGSAPAREMSLRVTVADVAGAKVAVTASVRRKPGASPANPGAQPSGPESPEELESAGGIPAGPGGTVAPDDVESREEYPASEKHEPAPGHPTPFAVGTEKGEAPHGHRSRE